MPSETLSGARPQFRKAIARALPCASCGDQGQVRILYEYPAGVYEFICLNCSHVTEQFDELAAALTHWNLQNRKPFSECKICRIRKGNFE